MVKYRKKWWWCYVHWEYWPAWMVYWPIFPYFIYLCIKARSPFFFFAANPTIANGGWDGESKFDIYNQTNAFVFAKSILVYPQWTQEQITSTLSDAGMNFPLYAKPDIGGKGKGVKLVHNYQQLQQLQQQYPIPYLLQKPCKNNCEIGVFYVRHPQENQGIITGIVSKQPLIITGDGIRSVSKLIYDDERARLQLPNILTDNEDLANKVLSKGEQLILSTIGNHARGSKFVDCSAMISPLLVQQVNKLIEAVPQFYYGRIDIMCKSIEDASAGGELEIIEINGAGSEPTHIYDSNKTVWEARKIIIQHWRYLYNVSVANHKAGVPYGTLKQGLTMFKEARTYARFFS